MPTHEIRGKRHLDLHTLAGFLAVVTDANRICKVAIEEPGAMPQQGVASTFKFGHACGVVQGMVAVLSIPLLLVRPNKWKAALGLTGEKDHSRQMASRLWPSAAGLFSRVKDADRAEAALLAYYAHKLEGVAQK